MWIRRALPTAAAAAVAVALWLVFYPAAMSADLLEQYGQARLGQIDDWHPPIMALSLAMTVSAFAASCLHRGRSGRTLSAPR